MKKLTVSEFRKGIGVTVMRVDGLTEEEIQELKDMPYPDMKDTLLNTLDEHCNGIGTVWKRGKGVYSVYFNNLEPESVFLEIGTNSD